MANSAASEEGREAFSQQRWADAYRHFCAVDREAPLDPVDLERLATAAFLIGKEAEAVAIWQRAHHALVGRGVPERAARIAFWLSLHSLLQGHRAQGAGWLGKARRLLASQGHCPERGFLCVIDGLMSMGKVDLSAAGKSFDEAITLAGRFREPDLMALGLLGRGQVLIQQGDVKRGCALFDEAMIGVTAGEVSPIAAGIVYCAVILDCERIFDLPRACEWTMALDRWCSAQPDLVPFRGPCLVHRAAIRQRYGSWTDALEENKRICDRAAQQSRWVTARAYYQMAEIHRLRGEFDLAERMYGEAGRHGQEPQPGMSLLRLAQGQRDAAAAAIGRMIEEATGAHSVPRPYVLGACVEIMLARGEVDAARKAADELADIAARDDALFLRALAAQAMGAVQLAEDDAKSALATLRVAWTLWQQLEAPHEAACARILLGRACARLGDHDTARIHTEGARSVFERLGAALPRTHVDNLNDADLVHTAAALTSREREVLSLVAQGRTNRQIATSLSLSEHTVARHVSNIFNKIDATTRTEASAFAFRHGLVLPQHSQS